MATSLDLVIFGGTGDLSRRKLLPALFAGLIAGKVSPYSRIMLTTRSFPEESVDTWLENIFTDTPPNCSFDSEALAKFTQMVSFFELPLTESTPAWESLKSFISNRAEACPLVHFLAIPPSLFTSTCNLLSDHGLNGKNARVVLEKPLGHDEESARKINTDVANAFREDQTFRIDHYLGKEAVQNLLALRFSNFLFEQLWSKSSIDHIQITIAENQGVQGRGAFYEGTGALKDMVQNHLLQLLCLIAMEPPARMDAECIRDEKLKVLKALEPLDGDKIDRRVIRGQYSSGAMDGKAVGSYREDLDLDKPSKTDSFVALKTYIQNWRWAGVPFYLRTGKRLPSRYAEITIQFKDIPHSPQTSWTRGLAPNRFIIRLQPQDHLALRVMAKDHGANEERLKQVELNLDAVGSSDGIRVGPYLRLILDAANDDQSLFVHRDEVVHAWRWVDKIAEHWAESEKSPLPYQAGSWGPYEAEELIRRDNRDWYNDEDSDQPKPKD